MKVIKSVLRIQNADLITFLTPGNKERIERIESNQIQPEGGETVGK